MRFFMLLVVSSLSMVGCSSAPDAATASSDEETLSTNGGFYLVNHVDARKCAAPACGGLFVQSINASTTLCADGTSHKECYVSGVDTSSLGLSSSDANAVVDAFGQRHAIVHATMGSKNQIGVLHAKDAWISAGGEDPTGQFYRVANNSIVCVVAPCPSITEHTLDKSNSQKISDLDLTSVGASSADLAIAKTALNTTDGIIVMGSHSTEKNGGTLLTATDFYLRVHPTGTTCGGITGRTCAAGQYCSFTQKAACGAGDQTGKCESEPQICFQLFQPVCGCDGQTYTNSCYANRAGTSVATTGACR